MINDGHFHKSKVVDIEETAVKCVDPGPDISSPQGISAFEKDIDYLNKSFDKTLFDSIIYDPVPGDKNSDGMIFEVLDEPHHEDSAAMGTKPKFLDTGIDSDTLRHIEENFSEALNKFKLSQEQFLLKSNHLFSGEAVRNSP